MASESALSSLKKVYVLPAMIFTSYLGRGWYRVVVDEAAARLEVLALGCKPPLQREERIMKKNTYKESRPATT